MGRPDPSHPDEVALPAKDREADSQSDKDTSSNSEMDEVVEEGTREEEASGGGFINYDYEGRPEPEEVFEEEQETQLGDREALASYERNGSPMDIDHEEPTVYQSDTESYKGMCSAEFEALMKEVEDGDEGRGTREDVNEVNSRPTDINFNKEESDLEEGTGENEGGEIKEGEEEEMEEGDEGGTEKDEEDGTEEGADMEANTIEGDESPKGPRRSKRISERGPAKSYATPTKWSKKTEAKESKGTCSRAVEGGKELRRALEDEFLQATPLNESQAEQADYYCGIRQAEEGAPGVGENMARGEDPEKEESVLGGINFDSDDALSDEEEEGDSASN